MITVKVDLQKLGGKFLYAEGRYDIVGACLMAAGIEPEVLEGYISPSDWAIAALIHQEIAAAKDHHVNIVNTLFLAPTTDFRNSQACEDLMMTYDAADEAGLLGDEQVQREVAAKAAKLGFLLSFTNSAEEAA